MTDTAGGRRSLGAPPLRVLYIEPFETGSHAAFTAALTRAVGGVDWTVLTLPGRHWKWRMRGAALRLAERHRAALAAPHDLLFASSFIALADLVALVPELARVPRILMFHENQWTYPVREERERDHHYGFTQLVSALVADRCLFNSQHNRDGFLRACCDVIARMPDARPSASIRSLARRCDVVPLPVDLRAPRDRTRRDLPPGAARERGPLILWNHRWEHDKAPDVFFDVLAALAARAVPFRVAVCGESYREVPEAFARGSRALAARIEHWGYVADPAGYRALLERAQIAVSTARHEFFGLSMLEATHAGALPLVPDRLAYPELFPAVFRYRDAHQLEQRLEQACRGWVGGEVELRGDRAAITAPYQLARAAPAWRQLLGDVARSPRHSGR